MRPSSSLPLRADIRAGFRLLTGLPWFLHSPVSPGEAQATVADRLKTRETDFVSLIRRAVYDHPPSPYRVLLGRAGCGPEDLARLVARNGIEGTLRTLLRRGVYLTVDELKGRRPVERDGLAFRVDPGGLRNPGLGVHLVQHSGGRRGHPSTALIDLRSIREDAADLRAFVDAIGSGDAAHAVWSVPGGTAMGLLLRFAAAGLPPARWFSQVDPAAPGLHPRYRWSARILRAGSVLAARPLPPAQHVPVDRPGPIAAWMAETLRAGRTPHLWTFASAAVLVCRAATAAGVRLDGARFTVSGEPITAARLAAVRATGAEAVSRYGASETGPLGYGCLHARWPDEMHFPSDLRAVVQPEADTVPPGLVPGSLLFTSLRPATRLVLLNVSVGDQATLTTRDCGCAVGALGWTTHLHTVRSEEKVTAGGMTFPDGELTRVLDEVLPARFGGGPTDYQLWEEEDAGGHSRLRLLVHPAVGPLDPATVAEAFLAAVGDGDGVERIMVQLWRDARLVEVERRAPESTVTGKIHHLRQRRAGARPAAAEDPDS